MTIEEVNELFGKRVLINFNAKNELSTKIIPVEYQVIETSPSKKWVKLKGGDVETWINVDDLEIMEIL